MTDIYDEKQRCWYTFGRDWRGKLRLQPLQEHNRNLADTDLVFKDAVILPYVPKQKRIKESTVTGNNQK